MFFELVDVEMFSVQPVISLMKSYRMIPDLGRNENQPNKIVVSFGLIYLEFVGFHLFLWFSI